MRRARGIRVARIAPRDKRNRPLGVDFMIIVGEPTQRGASTRLILKEPQLRRLINEAFRALGEK